MATRKLEIEDLLVSTKDLTYLHTYLHTFSCNLAAVKGSCKLKSRPHSFLKLSSAKPNG